MRDERLFVYGTLRPGALSQAPADVAEAMRTRTELVGAGSVSGALYRVSWYPALVEDASTRVVGDVLALGADLLAELDDYEGDQYERRRVRVAMRDGSEIEAWTYVFVDTAQLGARIESGDFLEALAPAISDAAASRG